MAFWNRKKKEDNPASDQALTWDQQARQAVEQSVAQAPVPAMLKGRVKRELEKAAEAAAQQAGRTEVTVQDVMNGMLAKMPPHMRTQVEEAMKKGPEGLKDLEKKFKK